MPDYRIDPPYTYQYGATLGESFAVNGTGYEPNGPSGSPTGYDGSEWLLADDSNNSGNGTGNSYGESDLALNFNTSGIPSTAEVENIRLDIYSCVSVGNGPNDVSEDLMLDWCVVQ